MVGPIYKIKSWTHRLWDVCAEADLRCLLIQMYSFKDEEVKAKGSDIIVQESILFSVQTCLNYLVRYSKPVVPQSHPIPRAYHLLSLQE